MSYAKNVIKPASYFKIRLPTDSWDVGKMGHSSLLRDNRQSSCTVFANISLGDYFCSVMCAFVDFDDTRKDSGGPMSGIHVTKTQIISLT